METYPFNPTTEASRDKLSPEVLSYIDNLKAQILAIYNQYDVHTRADLKALADREDVDTAMLKKLQTLVKQLERVVEKNEVPEQEKLAQIARRIEPEFQKFYDSVKQPLEDEHTPWYENLARIKAVAKAGEPRLAWQMYQKLHEGVPDEAWVSSEYDVPALLAIFRVGSHMDIPTISHSSLSRKLSDWKRSIPSSSDTPDLYNRYYYEYFLSVIAVDKIPDSALKNVFPRMPKKYQIKALFSVLGNLLEDHELRGERWKFESKLEPSEPEVGIEFYSRWYVQNQYEDPEDLDVLSKIDAIYQEKRLSADPTSVILATSEAYARMGLAEKAFDVFSKEQLNSISGVEMLIGMAAGFLEGPQVDVANAKRAINMCQVNHLWLARKDSVLEIVGALVKEGEHEFVKQFVQNYYCMIGAERNVELLEHTVSVFVDAGLDAQWAIDELSILQKSVSNGNISDLTYALRSAETAQHIRVFKRDVKSIRKLSADQLGEFIDNNGSDANVRAGIALSFPYQSLHTLSDSDDDDIDPATNKNMLIDTRLSLETKFGMDFLDSLVYGDPIE